MEENIEKALRDENLLQLFEALAPSHQTEYLKWVNEAKSAGTKDKRIMKMVKMLKQK